ncbi:hypothetical protein H072_7592 [Dactylellina haptotyla CBS 200.50]|uniref:F-box domain-containing protein n=1 Tax=Dactylellina haptotyla (strain CBS 200.50) TaxID=1284197 RepID=S8BH37_DACHA|nr:hypothetical protein H072_7592 [Dactylellina haptotyla CBS 200.50]
MDVNAQLSTLDIGGGETGEPSTGAPPTVPTGIHSVPTEILLHILTFLDDLTLCRTVRPVSRLFNSLALSQTSGRVHGLTPALWEYICSFLYSRATVLETRCVSPIFCRLIDDSQIEAIRICLWRGRIPEPESKLDDWWSQVHPFLVKPRLRESKQTFAKDSTKVYNSLGALAHETCSIPPVGSASIAVHFPTFANRCQRRRDAGLPPLSKIIPRRANNPDVVTVADVFIVMQKVVLDYWVDSVNILVKGDKMYVTEKALTDDLIAELDEGKFSDEDIEGADKEARVAAAANLLKNSNCIIDRGPRYGIFPRNNLRNSFEMAVVWDKLYSAGGARRPGSNWLINL